MSIQSLTEAAKAAGFAMATSDDLLTPIRQRPQVKLPPVVTHPVPLLKPQTAAPLGMAQRIRGLFVTFSRRAPA